MKPILTANDFMEELIDFIKKEQDVLKEKCDIIKTLDQPTIYKIRGEAQMLDRIINLSKEISTNIFKNTFSQRV